MQQTPSCPHCSTKMLRLITRARNEGRVENTTVAFSCLAHQVVLFVDRPGVIYKFMPEKEAKLLLSLKNIVSKGVGKEITKGQAATLFKDVARLLELSVIVQEPDLLENRKTADGRPEIPELPAHLATSESHEPDIRTKNMLDAEKHATNAALPGVRVAVSYRDDSDDVSRDASKVVDEIAGDLGKEIEAAKINDDINKKVGNDATVVFRMNTPSAAESTPRPEKVAAAPGEITWIHDERQVFPDFNYSMDRHMFVLSDGTDSRVAKILEKHTYKILAIAKLHRIAKNPDKWVVKREEASVTAAQ